MYREVSATAKKKLAKQMKLAEVPIEVPSLDGRKFDTRFLLDALQGRSDVLKDYGKSYAVIRGVAVPMKPLREWLTLFCQDHTGTLININKWTRDDWAYAHRDVNRDRKDKDGYGKRTLDLTFVSEGLDVVTNFKDQFNLIEKGYDGGYKDSPVFHVVVLKSIQDGSNDSK
jgi:hypothetical protein